MTEADGHREAGNLAFKEGRLDEALEHYTHAIAADPGGAAGWNNRAQTHIKLGNWCGSKAGVFEGDARTSAWGCVMPALLLEMLETHIKLSNRAGQG